MVAGAIAAVGMLAILPAVGRAAIMVDDFTSANAGVWPLSTNTPNPFGGFGNSESGLTDVLGNHRDEMVLSTTMDVPGYDTFRADLFHASGLSFVDVSSSAGAKGTLQLEYGVPNGSAFGLGHSADTQAVRVTFLAVDLANGGPLRIDLLPFEGSGAPVLPPVYVTTPGAQSVDLPLDYFWYVGSQSLDGLWISFTGDKGADFRIDSISLVPEPGMAAGLAIAAGAMALRRRKRA
jgi:hypothetical protein